MPWTLAELAALCGGRVEGDPDCRIDGFAAADNAGAGKLAFVTSAAWLGKLSHGAAAVIPPDLVQSAGKIDCIVADNPRLAFAVILTKTLEAEKPKPGIHESAVVEKSAVVASSAHVGALAYVGARAKIGAGAVLYPQSHVGDGAIVGENSVLYPHSFVGKDCAIGNGVIIGTGSSIGFDGFGYQWDGSRHLKIPQVGIAVVEDDVEIGALCAVDRAALGETRVGKGTKIDNFVMIAHNCRIGQNVLLIAQVGLSGSVTVGDNVILAGQVGVKDGVTIGAGTIVAGQSGVSKNIAPGKRLGGTPARNEMSWMRGQAALDKLPDLRKKVHELEARIERMESGKKTDGAKDKEE